MNPDQLLILAIVLGAAATAITLAWKGEPFEACVLIVVLLASVKVST